MKVYLDLVIIINFIYDLLILTATSVLLKRNTPFKRLLLSSLIGCLSIITLFIKIDSIFLILFKFLLSLIMVIVSFGKKNIVENTFYFYVITIIIGGSQYMLSGSAYKVNIVMMIIISPIILGIYLYAMNKYKVDLKKIYEIIIVDKDNTYNFKGYMDTGNTLIDPITKLPVIMINKNINFKSHKIFYVPYKVINNEAILKCIKVDKVYINSKEVNVLLGLIDENVLKKGIDIILNENIRGEITC